MLRFAFTANRSFIEKSTHPITIPRGQIDYETLMSLGLDGPDYSVICPKGERLGGRMYSGEAGFGHYYQLTVNTKGARLPGYLESGDELLVVLERVSGKNLAKLEFKN